MAAAGVFSQKKKLVFDVRLFFHYLNLSFPLWLTPLCFSRLASEANFRVTCCALRIPFFLSFLASKKLGQGLFPFPFSSLQTSTAPSVSCPLPDPSSINHFEAWRVYFRWTKDLLTFWRLVPPIP